ncbi:unnamed protein product, partial [Iphiclides podalirius]
MILRSAAALRSPPGRTNRRLTRNESRYHSEVRQEAVQQALAEMQNRPKPSLPMPSKRTSMMAKSPDRERHDLSSSSDEDSGAGDAELPPPPELDSPPARRPAAPHPRAHPHPLPQAHHQREKKHALRERTEIDLSDITAHLPAYIQPDVTHTTSGARRGGALVADRVQCYAQPEDTGTGTGRWKVSAKIQQLLNTLKRPKRRPLPEFYEDDDIELEIAANPKDPNAPKPEGGTMTPAVGEQLVVPAGLPRNLEAALQRYGTASFKANVATVLDPNGKLSNSLTYGKLLSRSLKIAHALLNKTFTSKSSSGGPLTGDNSIKPGDRVALVYPNNDPINFVCAFYGCLQAGVVPVPIEVPLTRRDAGLQQVGFLLGSCGIQYALTSDACLKGLPKTSSGDVVSFRGWPSLQWVSTEKLPRPPRDWIPPPRPAEDSPGHIEHTSAADGSAMGVIVTRASMLAHCRMLSVACNYTEGEHMVCVLDFKRETGLWHAVLASVLNGMHVIFIPYALMKVSPASWMHMITKYRASVAIVKSRDLHWGLLATRDHKEISLNSLRMLLVADGANPWSLSSCDQFLSVFQSKGVRGDAICPCACSSESLTVCVRRAGRGGSSAGRGVLSMSGLSYGVVRVDAENSLTSLTLQDCGQVMPSCVIVVVKMEGPAYLCKTDEVGEICVLSGATGSGYWGLPGLTNTVFRVRPLDSDGEPIGEEHYVRSGLLGFLGPGGLVFVCGSRDGLMTVTGRKHNMDDIIATVLAVEPMKFIYRGRIAVFSVRVLRDERIYVKAEAASPDASKEAKPAATERGDGPGEDVAFADVKEEGEKQDTEQNIVNDIANYDLSDCELDRDFVSSTHSKQHYDDGEKPSTSRAIGSPSTSRATESPNTSRTVESPPANKSLIGTVPNFPLCDDATCSKECCGSFVNSERGRGNNNAPNVDVDNNKSTNISLGVPDATSIAPEQADAAVGGSNDSDSKPGCSSPKTHDDEKKDSEVGKDDDDDDDDDDDNDNAGAKVAVAPPEQDNPVAPVNVPDEPPVGNEVDELPDYESDEYNLRDFDLREFNRIDPRALFLRGYLESFQWMSRVLQAVDSIHQVGIYCLALVQPNYLPKTPLGGIHLSECKRRFLEGTLHPANVLMCPHTCVTNLPKPREIHSDVGPASVIVGNLVQGNRLASAQGRDMGYTDDSDAARKYQFISQILRWRAQSTSDHVIFTLLNSKGAVSKILTCAELHKKAERIGNLLLEKGRVNTGDHVALIFPPGLDLICAFYGCLYVGAVPVTIRPPHPQNLHTTLPTVRMIVDVSKATLVLSNQSVIKLLRSKEASNVLDSKAWPITLDTDDMPKKKLPILYRAPTAEMLAYLDFSVSTTGMLAGIKMSHAAVTSLCRSMKIACELYPSRHIALCLDPYCGLGFALWCLSSIYSGHHSILIPPSEVEINPALWLSAVSQYKVRDTFCSYGVMELCTKGLGSSVNQLKSKGINLACVRTCVVVAEERPRINLTNSFSKLFSALGLSPRAVSTSFGCRVNIAICLQGASSPEPSTVYVDLRALRNDRVSLVERGSPHSLCLMESGKLLPGVKVITANPETKGQCGDSHLGEIWVQSPHNASGYFTIYGDESDYADHFSAQLVTGNTGEVYARTGYLGFLRRTEISATGASCDESLLSRDSDTESLASACGSVGMAPDTHDTHDAVFVVGALDETIMLRGMRYHPIDIENSVMRCHKKIAECAVFTWTNLLVVVVELDGNDSEALNLVPLVTNTVLEEHHLIVGVVVVVDPGVVPINSRGEKQRMHLRDGFLSDQIDAIYIAYNM